MASVEYCDLSFVGRREGNEDECLVLQLGPDGCFLAVADGMGGLEGGEVASHLVLTSARSFLENAFSSDVRDDDLKHIMLGMYRSAQKHLAAEKIKRPALRGMGTTLTCVLIKGGKYLVGNIGDSRVYLCRDGLLTQVTEDHTFIQQLLKENKKPDAAMLGQYSHYVTRCIEGGTDDPDIYPLEAAFSMLRDGDGFLLCSDGLITDKSDTAPDGLFACMTGTRDVRQAAEQLIARAFGSGSSDNISVIVATYGNFKRAEIGLKHYPYPPRDGEAVPHPTTRQAIPQKRRPFTIPGQAIVNSVLIMLGALLIYLGARHADRLHRALKSLFSNDTTAEHTGSTSPGQGSSPQADPTVTRRAKNAKAWEPFRLVELHPYKPADDFSWSEYEPADSLNYYEVSFGGVWSNTGKRNYANPGDPRGGRRENGKTYVKVRVRAILIDARVVESAEISIPIQSTHK